MAPEIYTSTGTQGKKSMGQDRTWPWNTDTGCGSNDNLTESGSAQRFYRRLTETERGTIRVLSR